MPGVVEFNSAESEILFPDGSGDVFNRLKVSQLNVLASYSFYNSPHDLAFFNSTATGGATTHEPGTGTYKLSTSTASGSTAIRQSKRYYRYTAGEAHRISMSSILGAAKANVRRRLGFFDAEDGLFFELAGTEFACVVRSSTSGSTVNTRITQANFNGDRLDGTGPSGVTFDPSKDNLFIIEYSWHGAGQVRFGIFLQGKFVLVHRYLSTNMFDTPYMRTGTLPIRFEIVNTAASASATDMRIAAFMFAKEGFTEPYDPYSFSRSNGSVSVSVSGTASPILSLRPTLLFAGRTNRVSILPLTVQLVSKTQIAVCSLVLNPVLSTPSWTNHNVSSAAQYDFSSRSFSGGTVLKEFYVPDSSSSEIFRLDDLSDIINIGLNIAGNTADIISIVGSSTGPNSQCWAAFTWREYQ